MEGYDAAGGVKRIFIMQRTTITLPEAGMLAGTRVLLGAGIGLLLSNCLRAEHRKPVAWTLIVVGILTTIPLAAEVLGNREDDEAEIPELVR
jgi:hypothetical protein